jgi:hypothetical protein
VCVRAQALADEVAAMLADIAAVVLLEWVAPPCSGVLARHAARPALHPHWP